MVPGEANMVLDIRFVKEDSVEDAKEADVIEIKNVDVDKK